jgi:CRISPR system Cascade subunit CasA
LSSLSKDALDIAGRMQHRVLKPAFFTLMEGGPDEINFDKKEVGGWWKQADRAFSTAWASDFFPWLWSSVEQTDETCSRADWLDRMRRHSEITLRSFNERFPGHEGRRYRALARAESMFTGCLYKQFPELKEIGHGAVGRT